GIDQERVSRFDDGRRSKCWQLRRLAHLQRNAIGTHGMTLSNGGEPGWVRTSWLREEQPCDSTKASCLLYTYFQFMLRRPLQETLRTPATKIHTPACDAGSKKSRAN